MYRLARFPLHTSWLPRASREGLAGDSPGDSPWLGGEAMIAPGYLSDLRALQQRRDDDCADPAWLTI